MITAKELMNKIEGYPNYKVILLSVIAAVPLLIFSFYYASSDDMEVLFSGMSENDITNVTMALDEKKTPYKVDLASSTINVNKNDVHNIRMSLMSDGAILDSNVGFEIFNDAEFGMTEFSQKINYQRALQGELSRTISSLKEIKYARIHIVQPKNRLFKSPNEKASASIVLFVKRGAKLSGSQIRGIQNIASSSIEGLEPDKVIVTNQSGIVLSDNSSDKLKGLVNKLSKRENIEKFYKDKVDKILKKSLSSEKFIVSVNVEFDYTKLTIQQESYLDGSGRKVIKREKISTAKKTGATTKDIEYKVGKRIENIEQETGRIKRISIGVLVPHSVPEEQVIKLKKVISMAIGIIPERGDSIALFADGFSSNVSKVRKEKKNVSSQIQEKARSVEPTTNASNLVLTKLLTLSGGNYIVLLNIMFAVIIILLIITTYMLIIRNKSQARLSLADKEKIVDELSSWFSKGK